MCNIDDIEAIEARIDSIDAQLDYCERRDEVCLALDGDQEVLELENERAFLQERLDMLEELEDLF